MSKQSGFLHSLWHVIKGCSKSALATNNNAKILLLAICYVVVFFVALPSTLERLSYMEQTIFTYALLIFLPIIWLVYFFSANFIGILVVLVCGFLSVWYAIFRSYVVLFLLYLLCAYPSMLYGGFISSFLHNIFEALQFLEKGAYGMLFAFYGRQIVPVFLFFVVFDMVYFWYKKHSIPAVILQNLVFSILLYIGVFGAYSWYYGKFMWH